MRFSCREPDEHNSPACQTEEISVFTGNAMASYFRDRHFYLLYYAAKRDQLVYFEDPSGRVHYSR